MKPVLVVYATREGQTERIATHVADSLRVRGFPVDVVEASEPWQGLAVDAHSAVILAASVHRGKHEPEMVEFVRMRRSDLATVPTAFLSVSLSEAGAEDAKASAEERTKWASDVQGMIDRFFVESGWSTKHVKPVAGALMYTRYSVPLKIIMKRIAQTVRASTDTSRDHEFTDWRTLDQFVEEFVASLPVRETAAVH
jgi:menaquinone-dependent protoporphyrinogen oxidase